MILVEAAHLLQFVYLHLGMDVNMLLSVSLLICQQFNWTNELDTPGQAVGVVNEPPGQALQVNRLLSTRPLDNTSHQAEGARKS